MPDQVSATFSSLALALGAKYDVKRLVGSGGFAEVYEVWDKDLERRLAVKVLRPDVAWTSGMIERFQRETRAAAKLEHPNILPIHFVGGGEGLVYYAMPFVDGMSLGELPKRSCPPPPCRPNAPSRSSSRFSTRSITRTKPGCCTETSSPTTSCSTWRAAGRCSSISGSRAGSTAKPGPA